MNKQSQDPSTTSMNLIVICLTIQTQSFDHGSQGLMLLRNWQLTYNLLRKCINKVQLFVEEKVCSKKKNSLNDPSAAMQAPKL